MKTDSTTSSRRRRRRKTRPVAPTPRRAARAVSADGGMFCDYVCNPRRVRRKRDARRWCDLLMVLAWNAPRSQLMPGDRLLTFEEQVSVSTGAEAWLAQADPTRYEAVRWVGQDDARRRPTLSLWRAPAPPAMRSGDAGCAHSCASRASASAPGVFRIY